MTEPTEKVYKEIDRHDPIITEGIENAPLYKKQGTIAARIAKEGERIETVLADGTRETVNTAEEGDMIVKNPGGEEYIVKPDKFNKRYTPKEGEDGVYEAKGYCKAIPNPFEEDVKMEASWGETQTGDSECMFADTYDPETGELAGEPYIIESEAFKQTYKKVEDPDKNNNPSEKEKSGSQKDVNNKWRPLQVRGLPEGTRITDSSGTSVTPKRMEFFRQIIEHGKFETRIVEDENGELYLDLRPPLTEGIEKIGEDTYLDTRLAYQDENGDIRVRPETGFVEYSEDKLPNSEGLLHRGMAFEEMKEIAEKRVIKSRGDTVGNNLTFFSKIPKESMGYAIEGQMPPGRGTPTFEYPAYHLSIKDPGNYDYEGGFEVALAREIKTEEITDLIEIRPYLTEAGRVPLERLPDGRLVPTNDIFLIMEKPLRSKVAIRKLEKETP